MRRSCRNVPPLCLAIKKALLNDQQGFFAFEYLEANQTLRRLDYQGPRTG